MEHRPIAITGMHRTGTSMVTRALHDSGLHLLGAGAEAFIDTAEDNPEGFWENAAIVACNDDLLEAAGGAWDNPPALPPLGADDPRVMAVNEAAAAALAGLRGHDHWGFKDPRTCLTAAYWLDLEPELQFVICLRHPLEVALSLKRRNQNSYSLGLALWERYYATVVELVPPERRIITHYDSFFTDPVGELARLCAFAGLEPADARVRSDLRHHAVEVRLAEAEVSPTLQALYADLCREAGVALPVEAPVDEGQVRRLVLDGAVARRHAEQRKEAIDRLEQRLKEREAELLGREADTEARLRTRIHDLEGQLVAVKALAETVARTERRVEIAVQAVKPGRGRRALRRWLQRLKKEGRARVVQPGRKVLRKGKRVAVPKAKAAAKHLPAPAQQALRTGARDTVPRAKAVAVPRAKAVARQLPGPAQDALRKSRTAVARSRQKAGRSGGGRPAPSSRAPRGTAPRQWQKSFERLVRANVPAEQPWLVVLPGSPAAVRNASATPGTPFPQAVPATLGLNKLVGRLRGGDRVAGGDLSHVAELEALRFQGHRYLVLPAESRPWFRAAVELRDHVTSGSRTLADDDAGTVFALGERNHAGTQSLRAEIAERVGAHAEAPAVLDWTDLDLAPELPGLTTFRPPAGDRLPYLDASVEIVVVDRAHDHAEATRVASATVITVEPSPAGAVAVATVELGRNGAAARTETPRPLVLTSDPRDDARWREALATAVAPSGAEVRFTRVDAASINAAAEYDVLIALEPYVVPLPGAIETAIARAIAEPETAVAGKVLRADGRIEAAGGIIFFDRSTGLIANGSADVRAPWHEYVRAVCWAPGVVAASGALWQRITPPAHVNERAFIREWCSEVWAAGHRVCYQPGVAAVRVTGDGGEPSLPLEQSAWQRVLDLRPKRPAEFDDGVWRYLLAHDDVESCQG